MSAPTPEDKMTDVFYQHHQADMLAAAILMPKEITLKTWGACYSVESLADIFEVPIKAVVIRLEMLGVNV